MGEVDVAEGDVPAAEDGGRAEAVTGRVAGGKEHWKKQKKMKAVRRSYMFKG
jgi:hypothetical protein